MGFEFARLEEVERSAHYLEMIVWLEAIKLGAQLIGAVVIARLTVKWALSRYKEEKVWERKLASYSDVIAAVGEMLRVTNEWLDDEELRRDRPDLNEERSARYSTARRKLLEVTATGRLLLSSEAQGILAELNHNMDTIPKFDFYEDLLAHQSSVLESSLSELVGIGRADLGMSGDIIAKVQA